MSIDLATLPDDVNTLHRMIGNLVVARDTERTEALAEIDRLRQIVKALQRNQFGRRSERLDEDQLQLGLEDIAADIAQAEAACPEVPEKDPKSERRPSGRLSLPDHLPREDTVLNIDTDICPPGRRAQPLDFGELGRERHLVARAAQGPDRGPCICLR